MYSGKKIGDTLLCLLFLLFHIIMEPTLTPRTLTLIDSFMRGHRTCCMVVLYYHIILPIGTKSPKGIQILNGQLGVLWVRWVRYERWAFYFMLFYHAFSCIQVFYKRFFTGVRRSKVYMFNYRHVYFLVPGYSYQYFRDSFLVFIE